MWRYFSVNIAKFGEHVTFISRLPHNSGIIFKKEYII